jgi:transposase
MPVEWIAMRQAREIIRLKAASVSAPEISRRLSMPRSTVREALQRAERDKAKVESAVLIVERWLLGRLRRKTFYNLAEVNAAIDGTLNTLNEERPIRPARRHPVANCSTRSTARRRRRFQSSLRMAPAPFVSVRS